MVQLPAIVIIALQLITLVHAVKNGRTSPWIYLILFLPIIGSLAYIYIEILSQQRMFSLEGLTAFIDKLLTRPAQKIARLEKELSFIDTITTRENLAKAYFEAGNMVKAIEYYNSCLNNLPANDLPIRNTLVKLYIKTKQYSQGLAEISVIQKQRLGKLTSDEQFCLAQIQENLGNYKEALESYSQAVNDYHSLEINYRYLLLLTRQNKLAEILEQMRLAQRKYEQMLPRLRGPEKTWLKSIEKEFSLKTPEV